MDPIWREKKPYDRALLFKKEENAPPEMRGKKNYPFPRPPPRKVARGFEFVKEPIKKFARHLRAKKRKDIWMMGGAGLVASFLDEGEIDEFIIHVIPTLIGEGIPLVAPRHRTVPLKLLSIKKFSDGVLRLHYEVLRKRKRQD